MRALLEYRNARTSFQARQGSESPAKYGNTPPALPETGAVESYVTAAQPGTGLVERLLYSTVASGVGGVGGVGVGGGAARSAAVSVPLGRRNDTMPGTPVPSVQPTLHTPKQLVLRVGKGTPSQRNETPEGRGWYSINAHHTTCEKPRRGATTVPPDAPHRQFAFSIGRPE